VNVGVFVKKYKKGFTLVELLAVLLILGIVIGFVFLVINSIFKDVDDSVDKVTKNIILDAANDYAIEYKDANDWKEHDDGEKTIFCISLDTLMERGYFKNDESNYEKYRNKYAVKAEGINGVYKYEFVELSKLDDSDICRYYRRESVLIDENGNKVDSVKKDIVIKDDKTGSDLGTLESVVSMMEDNRFKVDFNLDVQLYDIVENKDVYVSVVLDKSNSMRGDKYDNATQAAVRLSEILSENNEINAQMALIQFAENVNLKRDFSTEIFDSFDILDGGTNPSAGLDLTSSLIYNKLLTDNLYTILLFDGEPNFYPIMRYNRKDYNLESIYKENGNSYDMVNKADIYFKNYPNNKNGISFSNKYNLNENDVWNKLIASGGYLKNLNSKLIVIGYDVDFGSKANNLVTKDKDLCSNSKDGEHCYYYEADASAISGLFTSLANKIIELSSVDKIELILKSAVYNGDNLVDIFDLDGNKVDIIKKTYNYDDVDEFGNLNVETEYRFAISDSYYEKIKCVNNVCSYDDIDKFLDVSLELWYPDGTVKKIEIQQPNFDINLYKESLLN